MNEAVWNNDTIQFPRLIEEALAAGAFTDEVIADMAVSMDLEKEQIYELLDRSRLAWELVVNQL